MGKLSALGFNSVMTCEIAIMNKQAVVLAADSATTVTQWINGNKEERYFKGTNKIFELSNHHPVGMMTYAAANLQGVPWDIVAKDFREQLGPKSFNDLGGYAQELFDYVKGHGQLYPAEFQKSSFLSDGSRAATLHLIIDVMSKEPVKDAATDDDRKAAIEQILADDIAAVDAEGLSSHFEQSDLDDALATYSAELTETLETQLKDVEHSELIDIAILAELAIKLLVKRYPRYMDKTGIVLAGFGDNDYFPSYREYDCYGLLLGKFLFDEKDRKEVGRDTPSFIKPFATTAMVNTFVMGFSPDVYEQVWYETRNSIRTMAESLAAEHGFDLPEDLDEKLNTMASDHIDAWTDTVGSNHAWPLQRVIGALPVDEMAELAETLIMLESLKEKVTQPTESVGGPIDVCVISKSEGFVWIRRKHYFKPELNPQFFRRQEAKFK